MRDDIRYLMIAVGEGSADALFQLNQFYNLACASGDVRKRFGKILSWLIKNRLTGDRFAKWVNGEHEGSALQATAHIIAKIEGREVRPIKADPRDSGPLPLITLPS